MDRKIEEWRAVVGRCTGICENDIRACCNKPDKCKSAGGYKWRLYSKDVG